MLTLDFPGYMLTLTSSASLKSLIGIAIAVIVVVVVVVVISPSSVGGGRRKGLPFPTPRTLDEPPVVVSLVLR